MKKSLMISLLAFSALSVNAENNNFDLSKDVVFGKFKFIGCVIEIDNSQDYVYFNIRNTSMTTVLNQVSIVSQEKRIYNERLDDKKKIVKEYIERQNSCTLGNKS